MVAPFKTDFSTGYGCSNSCVTSESSEKMTWWLNLGLQEHQKCFPCDQGRELRLSHENQVLNPLVICELPPSTFKIVIDLRPAGAKLESLTIKAALLNSKSNKCRVISLVDETNHEQRYKFTISREIQKPGDALVALFLPSGTKVNMISLNVE